MFVDWFAAGINPARATIFIQSRVPEHAELALLLGMIAPVGWLERVPTYKDQQQKLADRDLSNYGFLGYPVMQAADILIYRANMVPVGEDQVSHIELVRELARRFNFIYGREPGFEDKAKAAVKKLGVKKARRYGELRTAFQEKGDGAALEAAKDLLNETQNLSLGDRERLFGYLEGSRRVILPEPGPLLTETPKVPGLDGQKMSKSLGNAIEMREEPAEVTRKIRTMQTDPARVRRSDKGDPNRCPVWPLHQIYSDAADARVGRQGLHDGGHRLSRMQAAADRRDHPGAGADPRARAALSRRSPARAQHRRRRLRARAQARRGDDARRSRRHGARLLVSETGEAGIVAMMSIVELTPQGGAPVAKVYGEPMLELPHDLYIPPEALEVFLDTFEGPLDLLLYLIRKQNINVLEIPMAELTRQYLGYVEMMRRTQLELAAEYLLMAAVLIEIKSRLLLPKPPAAAGAEPEDPARRARPAPARVRADEAGRARDRRAASRRPGFRARPRLVRADRRGPAARRVARRPAHRLGGTACAGAHQPASSRHAASSFRSAPR